MPTSVHIPDKLLQQADRRAKSLGISRNRLIVRALERELQSDSSWPAGFFEKLRAVDDETVQAVDEMMAAVRRGRRSKSPQQY
jgi:predicted transcriptional regulator